MKIRSLVEFESRLDQEFAWRRRETSTLKLNLKSARSAHEETLFRSSIVLLYAHWEGIVKMCAESYIIYLNGQGEKYSAINPCFLFFATKLKLGDTAKINIQNFSMFERAQELFCKPLDEKFKVDPSISISTRENQNMTSSEFKYLLGKIGLPYLTEFELKEKLIDEQLLRYRNQIAHGENIHEDISDLYETFEHMFIGVWKILDLYRKEIVSAIENKLYLRNSGKSKSKEDIKGELDASQTSC